MFWVELLKLKSDFAVEGIRYREDSNLGRVLLSLFVNDEFLHLDALNTLFPLYCLMATL